MTRQRLSVWVAVVFLLGTVNLPGQSGSGTSAISGTSASVVPRLIKFSGEINPQTTQIKQTEEGEDGKNGSATPITVTFSLYELQEGGSPLWSEVEKVLLDEQGRYTVLLGATVPEGLPLDLFTSGEALWLGVQPQLSGAVEQPRVLLVAVPYALKAADSDTLGGKPASAYALAGSPALVVPAGASYQSSNSSPLEQATNPSTTGATPEQPAAPCLGLTDDGKAATPQVALYSGPCALTEDKNFVDVAGKVGIGTNAPSSPLNVVGTFGSISAYQSALNVASNWTPTANDPTDAVFGVESIAAKYGAFNSATALGVRGVEGVTENFGSGKVTGMAGMVGVVENRGKGTITNAYGTYLYPPQAAAGSPITNGYGIYISGQKATGVTNGYGIYTAGAHDINYLAGSVGIGTATPAALLEVNGTARFDAPVIFATGQTFPIPKSGVTNAMLANSSLSIMPGIDLTGGGQVPLGGATSLSLDTNKVPQLATPNTFAGKQTISTGDLSLSNGNLDLPSTTSATSGVINLGGNPFIQSCCFSSKPGNGASTNMFVGLSAGNFSTTGTANTATGAYSLSSDTAGSNNTASGYLALLSNTTGNGNTADGNDALYSNTTGFNNTAIGNQAGYNGQFSLPATGSNSTFIGAYAAAKVDKLTNATAIGYNAQVSQSNTIVLGATSDVSGNPLTTQVGIGTSLPDRPLSIVGSGSGLEMISYKNASQKTVWHVNLNPVGHLGLNFAETGVSDGRLFLMPGGTVGINTITPNSKYALDVNGNLNVSGSITAGTKDFKIDDPVDPEHKDLYHASIESSEMMDLYTGNVILDAAGEAVVLMPEWFEALNEDFRYQLTAVGAPGPNLYVKEKVQNNRFRIAGGVPGGEVSWQVTGIRHDAWAKAHQLQVEQRKSAAE